MERKSKLSISLTLAIIAVMILGLTSAVFAPPLNIGDPGYTQAESFDSNPTAGSFLNVGTPTGPITNAFDGDFGTNINFIYGAVAAAGFVEVNAFKAPSANGLTDFPIAFLDIKVDYRATALATTLDRYRIIAIVGANTLVLQDYVWGTDPLNHPATYPPGINAQPGVRTFSNVQEPTDGVWSWGDVAALRVRIETAQGGTLHTSRVYLFDVFATAYVNTFPQPLQMTVIPSAVMQTTGGLFYVDIYMVGVTQLWGFQFVLQFDPTVLAAVEYMSYSPFISALPSEIGTDYVAVAYKTYDGDPVGFTGNTPLARVWFAEINPGTSCDLPFSADSPPTLANIFGAQITITCQGGAYNKAGPVPEFPLGLTLVMLLIPALPVVYLWRMRRKERV